MKNIPANTPFQTTADKICALTETTPAHLLFSVDGNTYTQWSDAIQENNVVISNIPVGTFLKFDQDAVITDK